MFLWIAGIEALNKHLFCAQGHSTSEYYLLIVQTNSKYGEKKQTKQQQQQKTQIHKIYCDRLWENIHFHIRKTQMGNLPELKETDE